MQQLLPAFVGVPQTNRVYNVTAEVMLSALPSDSIDLIVTSPPYDNLRTYKGFTWDFEYIARQSYRVLKPGGVLVWVVGDATVNGSESLTSFKQAIHFVEIAGFRLHDTMIWHKDGSPFPESNRYLQTFEFMLVLSKGSPNTCNQLKIPTVYRKEKISKSDATRNANGTLSLKKYEVGKEYRTMDNVWYVTSGYMKTTKDKEAYDHPAMFPEALAERHILTWSNTGDTVLDFFGGSGTTAKMARKNGRKWMTNDISREYCDLMERRLNAPYTPSFMPQLETA